MIHKYRTTIQYLFTTAVLIHGTPLRMGSSVDKGCELQYRSIMHGCCKVANAVSECPCRRCTVRSLGRTDLACLPCRSTWVPSAVPLSAHSYPVARSHSPSSVSRFETWSGLHNADRWRYNRPRDRVFH